MKLFHHKIIPLDEVVTVIHVLGTQHRWKFFVYLIFPH